MIFDMIKTFPKTRYLGSKLKMLPLLKEIFSELEFETALDAFSGTCSVSYLLKSMGKQVFSNDILRFNYHISKALIENNRETISNEILSFILNNTSHNYKNIIEANFGDIYYLPHENAWLDRVIQNIKSLPNSYQKEMLYWVLFQACLSKRPYNLFHRKNLYIRTSDTQRSFGNKTTWDKGFDVLFKKFSEEANKAILDNNKDNKAFCQNVFDLELKPDLVYIDTPYIPQKGSLINYRDFYHFLEGIVNYDEWENLIDYDSKHKKLISKPCVWEDKNRILQAFNELFYKFKNCILVVSYRDDGIPTIDYLVQELTNINKDVKIHQLDYQYALSKNKTKEVVLVAK